MLRMPSLRWCTAATVALTLIVAPSVDARAQTPPKSEAATKAEREAEARQRFQRGTELTNEADYKLALIEFRRAYELNPSYRILYNLGSLNVALGNYADALRDFETYLREGGNEIPAKRRADVEKEIRGLKSRTAHLEIVVNVEGADVTVDDVSVGKSPLNSKLLLSAGQRRIVVSMAGRTPMTKLVTLAGQDDSRIEFNLVEESTKPAEPVVVPTNTGTPGPVAPAITPDKRPAPTPVPSRSDVWIGWTTTGVLAAGGIAVGIAALASNGSYKTMLDDPTATAAEQESARSKGKTLALVADVLGASAVIVGGISLYFTLAKPSPTNKTAARRDMKLSFGARGASLSSSF